MDADFWEEVERSKRMTPEQRFALTMELSDLVQEFRIAGVRHDFPDATDAEVRAMVRKRIEIAESLGVVR